MKDIKNKWKWSEKKEIPYFDNNFIKIFIFFLLECPIKGISKRNKTFEECKINQSSFVSKLKKEIPYLKNNWETFDAKKSSDFLAQKDVLKDITFSHCFAYHSNYQKNESNSKEPVRTKLKGFFYCIRCAFAHGDFNIRTYNGKKYYQFQNSEEKSDLEVIKGRIIMDEESLLKIIGLFKNHTS